ncbi:MAG: type II toxin-antitoxin system PemK/MazF family toxin [Dehalococcoidia bacterium]
MGEPRPDGGAELRKSRPALVVSADGVGNLPVRMVVPFTTSQPRFDVQRNKVRIAATESNGLARDSAADVLQARAVSLERFASRVGFLEQRSLIDVVTALAVLIGFEIRSPDT